MRVMVTIPVTANLCLRKRFQITLQGDSSVTVDRVSLSRETTLAILLTPEDLEVLNYEKRMRGSMKV
jgi:hypothetical protein